MTALPGVQGNGVWIGREEMRTGESILRCARGCSGVRALPESAEAEPQRSRCGAPGGLCAGTELRFVQATDARACFTAASVCFFARRIGRNEKIGCFVKGPVFFSVGSAPCRPEEDICLYAGYAFTMALQ